VVSRVKLIAEPWDIGPGGYQVGNFPPQWTEWNGAYRDAVRDFWRGECDLGGLASRLAGSADLYEHSGRRPFASINFVTAHDGFTLRDLVSYNEKHNEANGEDNNDGESHNRSWNHGVEGPTDDPEILAARAREQRNFLTTLLLSQGVPMIAHGDEIGRTQEGNNNGYAQDTELTWMHWDRADQPLLDFAAFVAKLRAGHPTFRRKRFFTGTTVRTGDGEDGRLNDIVWLDPQGEPMVDDAWDQGDTCLGMYLNGHGIAGTGSRGERIVDDHFVLWFNGGGRREVTLPPEEYAAAWTVVLDTGSLTDPDKPYDAGAVLAMEEHSVVVLQEAGEPEVEPDYSVEASVASQTDAAQNEAAQNEAGEGG
jgi:glycogen operon protein